MNLQRYEHSKPEKELLTPCESKALNNSIQCIELSLTLGKEREVSLPIVCLIIVSIFSSASMTSGVLEDLSFAIGIYSLEKLIKQF